MPAQHHPHIPLLAVTGLACVRGDRLVFSGVALTLEAGAALWVRGANGSGKSSLLRILAGLLRPIAGEVSLHGLAPGEDGAAYRRHLSWLGHQDGLKSFDTPMGALRFQAQLHGREAPASLLDELGLAALAHTKLRHLSAGQRRRAALAGMMATGADLWLLDEPETALDTTALDAFRHMCLAHLYDGGAIVSTGHGAPLLSGMAELVLG